MTIEATTDPLAGLASGIPEATARDHAAMVVRGGGASIETANVFLRARNFAPLIANSKEAAETARGALLNDGNFVARYIQGDPEAMARLFQADLQVQQSAGKLTDRPAAASDYNLRVAPHMPDAEAATIQNYSGELASLAASIQLPKESAQALVDDHFAALKEMAGLSKDEERLFAERQTLALHRALGPDAEARIDAASDTLSKVSGRKLDLAAIVRSNGASVALTLLHQAEVLRNKS